MNLSMIRSILQILNIIGISAAVLAIVFIALTFMLVIQTSPKALKQRIRELTPNKRLQAIRYKRTVEKTIQPEVQSKLDEWFQEAPLDPGWQRIQ